MDYVSAKKISEQWGISKRRVLVLCKEGRIPGAKLIDSSWIIPSNALKPDDGRSSNIDSIDPIKECVKAEAHTPQYRMHKYFARRPYNVFNNLIRHYTKEGDIVLDCFCGGGVTVFEAASLNRKPIGVDINPLATFITRMEIFTGSIKELEKAFDQFITRLEKQYSHYYDLKFKDDDGSAIWSEWAYTVKCPECGATIELTDDNKISNGVYRCPDNRCKAHNTGVKRVDCQAIGYIPTRVQYISNKDGVIRTRALSFEDMPDYSEKTFSKIIDGLPYKPIFDFPDDWDRQHEDKLKEKGVISYSDLFTKRNFMLNCLAFNEIMENKKHSNSKLNEYLYFLFSSSLRYTNKMTRVTDSWEGGNPTAMDKHAYWLPNVFVETNIFHILRKRASAIIKGCEYSVDTLPSNLLEANSFDDLKLHQNAFMALNRSSSSLPLPDKSVDIIITDPPYGSNVQYAELSTVWNAWYAIYANLDNYIYKKEEAVVNRKHNYSGSKTEEDYEKLLTSVYLEGSRVLKDGGYLVFTFNNKNIKVWIAMLKSVAEAGFYLPKDGILFQDYIKSYKNTAHLRFSGNIQGDFIYSFKKGAPENTLSHCDSFTSLICSEIDKTILELFRHTDRISTPCLYQKIFTNMTSEIMNYILYCKKYNISMEDIQSLPDDYIDSKLRSILVYEGGIWHKKGETK